MLDPTYESKNPSRLTSPRLYASLPTSQSPQAVQGGKVEDNSYFFRTIFILYSTRVLWWRELEGCKESLAEDWTQGRAVPLTPPPQPQAETGGWQRKERLEGTWAERSALFSQLEPREELDFRIPSCCTGLPRTGSGISGTPLGFPSAKVGLGWPAESLEPGCPCRPLVL